MNLPAYDVRILISYGCPTTGQDVADASVSREELYLVGDNDPHRPQMYSIWGGVQCPRCGQQHGIQLSPE